GLRWLGRVFHIPHAVCLVRPPGGQMLSAVATYGIPAAEAATFAVLVEDWGHPLVGALTSRRHLYFSSGPPRVDRRRRPATPVEDSAFHVLPLGGLGFSKEGFGLLLFTGGPHVPPGLEWFANAFGQKLDQILRDQAFVDGDRKQGRERSLLYSIINAVTDPILLTDTDGRLLIANVRALTLFTASEEESEGRRSAVRMNNMLLSSALSSKAIEE